VRPHLKERLVPNLARELWASAAVVAKRRANPIIGFISFLFAG
jgi:hypothetical protein